MCLRWGCTLNKHEEVPGSTDDICRNIYDIHMYIKNTYISFWGKASLFLLSPHPIIVSWGRNAEEKARSNELCLKCADVATHATLSSLLSLVVSPPSWTWPSTIRADVAAWTRPHSLYTRAQCGFDLLRNNSRFPHCAVPRPHVL